MAVQILIIPSTALILDGVRAPGDGSIAALRTAIGDTVADRIGGRRVVVVAADAAVLSGPPGAGEPVSVAARQLVPVDGRVHLGGLGLPWLGAAVRTSPVPGLTQVPNHPGPDLAVLAVRTAQTVPSRHADLPVAPPGIGGRPDGVGPDVPPTPVDPPPTLVGLPVTSDPDAAALMAGAAALALHRLSADEPLTVVCAGDLAAGHGAKPPRPQVGGMASAEFDRDVRGLLDDPRGLADLAVTAGAVAARGLPSLLVAAHLAQLDGQVVGSVMPTTVDGVGGVVAVYG